MALIDFVAECVAFAITGSACNVIKQKDSKKRKKEKKEIIKLLQRMQ